MVEQRLNQTLADLDLPAQLVVDKYNRPGLLSETAPDLVAAANAEIMSSFHPLGMRTMVRALAAADLRDVLPHIDVPTLLSTVHVMHARVRESAETSTHAYPAPGSPSFP